MFSDKSCIAAILGVYRIQHGKNKKSTYFLATRNVYPSDYQFLRNKYDLKGSLIGRKAHLSSSVKKDLDLLSNGNLLRFGPSREVVLQALQRDVSFLSRHNCMDYSLLIAEEVEIQEEKEEDERVKERRKRKSFVSSPSMLRFGSSFDRLSVTSLDPSER